MTSQSIKDISRMPKCSIWEMTQELHVMKYSEKNIVEDNFHSLVSQVTWHILFQFIEDN